MSEGENFYDPNVCINFQEGGVPLRVSKSSMMTYLKCPKLYWWEYIMQVSPPPSDAMIRGTTIHEIYEVHLKDGIPLVEASNKVGFTDVGVEQFAEILEQWEEFGELEFVESEFKHQILHNIGGYNVMMVGKIDAIFRIKGGGLVLVELKTGELGSSKIARTRKELNFYRFMLQYSDKYKDEEITHYMVIAPDASNVVQAEKLESKRSTKVLWGITGGLAYMEKFNMRSYNSSVEKFIEAIPNLMNEQFPMNWNEFYCPEWCAYHLSCSKELV